MLSLYANGETVERRHDASRQLGFQIGVKMVVREMCQIRAFGTNRRRCLHRFGYAEMSRMSGSEERVDDEDARSPERRHRAVGNRLCVGDVGERANSISEYRNRTVR